MSLPVFLLICAATNLWAFVVFGFDKVAAVRAQRRTSEANLLSLTLIGGVGSMAACSLFRHKTRKQPFRRNAELLAGLHVVLIAFVVTLLL